MRSTKILLAVTCLAVPATAQVDWTRGPEAFERQHVRMDFDTARGRLVVIGGTDHTPGVLRGVESILESAGGPWERIVPPDPGPGGIFAHALAFDAARGVTIVFGGLAGGASASTWLWDGVTWRAGASGPRARWNAAMAYDAGRRRVVLFGGVEPPGVVLDDTWEWDGNTWTERFPRTVPPGRWGHAMAYDAARGRSVMFAGGYAGAPAIGETWEWDGNDWTLRTPLHAPAQRFDHAMAYDPLRARVVLHGGRGSPSLPLLNTETWEWDGSDWAQPIPATSVGAFAHGMAFDPTRGRVVMYGSYDHAVVYEWDGSDWVVDPRRSLPFSVVGSRLAWDGRRERVLMYPPAKIPGRELWAYDGTAWGLVDSGFATTGLAPDDRRDTAWVYDAHRDVFVLFGGHTTAVVDELWEFDGARWQLARTAMGPRPRIGHAMVFDPARRRVLVFGGETGGVITRLDDTWEWDGSGWTQRSVAIAPAHRRDAAIAYDPLRGRVVLYGGRGHGDVVLGDTWEWDGTSWTERHPAGAPGPRTGASMSWDAARRRCVLVGGVTSDVRVWEWDGADWVARDVGTPLPPHEGMGFAYDTVRRIHVGHGGRAFGSSRLLADTWLLAAVAPATVAAFGAACPAGSAHSLSATWLPWLDTTFELLAEGFASGAAVVVFCGFSDTSYGGFGLPLPLDPVGMPGCSLWVSLDVPLPTTGSVPTATLAIPNDPSLIGGALYFQSFGTAPGANPLGVAATGALAATLGAR